MKDFMIRFVLGAFVASLMYLSYLAGRADQLKDNVRLVGLFDSHGAVEYYEVSSVEETIFLLDQALYEFSDTLHIYMMD